MTKTTIDLPAIIAAHGLWLRGKDGGKRANLSGANLSRADLSAADLYGANLSHIKNDFLTEVLKLPNELDALRSALIDGRVDGSTYQGECACLAGTLANAKQIENYRGDDIEVSAGVTFHAASDSPRERFFYAIKEGDKPETNQASAIALAWTEEAIAIRDMIRASAKQVAPR